MSGAQRLSGLTMGMRHSVPSCFVAAQARARHAVAPVRRPAARPCCATGIAAAQRAAQAHVPVWEGSRKPEWYRNESRGVGAGWRAATRHLKRSLREVGNERDVCCAIVVADGLVGCARGHVSLTDATVTGTETGTLACVVVFGTGRMVLGRTEARLPESEASLRCQPARVMILLGSRHYPARHQLHATRQPQISHRSAGVAHEPLPHSPRRIRQQPHCRKQ